MSLWFSALCPASTEPPLTPCPVSVDGWHWCTDLPAHADLHRCMCGAWFSGNGLVVSAPGPASQRAPSVTN